MDKREYLIWLSKRLSSFLYNEGLHGPDKLAFDKDVKFAWQNVDIDVQTDSACIVANQGAMGLLHADLPNTAALYVAVAGLDGYITGHIKG